jgi:hypothetical protein
MLALAKGQDARGLKDPSEVFSQGNITRLLTASDSYRSHPSHCNCKPQTSRASVRAAACRTGETRARLADAAHKEGWQHQ